ncbi:MAG: F0F1 ATP synthase subunit gamma [Magnetospirillum sp. WYHS-4]
MPNLKDLRVRITSVKSTQKITSAMKMVAASKLRRAQVAAEQARPYAQRMDRMLSELVASLPTLDGTPRLLSGTGSDQVHLIVAMTADRGLCGGFNANVAREVRKLVTHLRAEGKTPKILCIGRKGRDALKRDHADLIIATHENLMRTGAQFDTARMIGRQLRDMYAEGQFDVCTIVFNRFQSAISQVVTAQQLIPFPVPATAKEDRQIGLIKPLYILEPSEEELLGALLPRNLSVQVFRAMLEGYASEQGARMTAMDNATRNAGDMINALTLKYNRTRQAYITKELIEIISGAEAL